MTVSIGTDEHVMITGMTGSGKSYLAEIYLRGFDHVVKLDTKGEYYERKKKRKPVWEGLTEGKDYTVIKKLKQIDAVTTKKIIYVPDFDEQTEEFYNALMKWVYDRENTTLWIDELMSVSTPHKYPTYLKALLTRGRSKDASVWALTQRPMDIPTIVMANCTHFFIFNMALPQDRKKVAESTGQPKMYEKPGYRNFWYFKDGQEESVLSTLKVN